MTRITNIGRKRTYFEAGFEKHDGEVVAQGEPEGESGTAASEVLLKSKKPRKRRRKGKTGSEAQRDEEKDDGNAQVDDGEKQYNKPRSKGEGPPKTTLLERGKRKRTKDKSGASEHRRLKRISERHAGIICLACRKQGHAVKDCPDARTAMHEDENESTGVPGKSAVGICYRCGSTRHNLSRCKKPLDVTRPLPFASCFVCSGRGHLASSCPQNQGRGIYPNGGSCKLCGQTSHLAKDCELGKQVSRSVVMLGGGKTEAGADEDDFHTLKRRQDEVERDEKIHRKAIRHPEVTVKTPKPKVVVFH